MKRLSNKPKIIRIPASEKPRVSIGDDGAIKISWPPSSKHSLDMEVHIKENCTYLLSES